MSDATGTSGTPGAREAGIVTPRSARYYLLGGSEDGTPPDELWIVLHGYGQLAGRFIRHFRGIAGPRRLVVAPEALSRFYVAGPDDLTGHAKAPVGATWMTREDREREIADQQAYLDAVLAAVRTGTPRLTVLGFSQGVATMARWVASGRVTPDHVIAWAGGFPAELDAAGAARFAGRLTVVFGRADALVPAARAEAGLAHLRTLGVDPRVEWFDGGHVMDGVVLGRLAD